MAISAPTFFIRVKPVGDTPVRVDLGERLLSLEYEDNERKADRLQLVIDNYDLTHFDDPIFKKGNIIEVSWGYPGFMSPVRECKITKISGFQQLQVEALDKAVLFNTKARHRFYEGWTRSEVAKDIAEQNGFGADRQFIQRTTVRYPAITQARLTDAQMLKRLAHKEGFEWYIDHDGFHFHERVLDQQPVRRFVWYYAQTNAEGVLAIDVQNDVYAKPGRVKVKAIDPDTKEKVEGSGSNDDTTRDGLGELSELYIAVDDTTDNLEFSQLNADDDEMPDAVQGEIGAQQAKEQADRRFRKAAQVAVKMNMTVIGDPLLLAKSVVRVEGVGKRLTGNYYIKSARHSVSAQGYTTELEMISDGTRGYQRISDLLLDDKKKAKKKPTEPENGAAKNDKDPKTDEGILVVDALGDHADELRYLENYQRENLPAGVAKE